MAQAGGKHLQLHWFHFSCEEMPGKYNCHLTSELSQHLLTPVNTSSKS
jgi:hypothetical protein